LVTVTPLPLNELVLIEPADALLALAGSARPLTRSPLSNDTESTVAQDVRMLGALLPIVTGRSIGVLPHTIIGLTGECAKHERARTSSDAGR